MGDDQVASVRLVVERSNLAVIEARELASAPLDDGQVRLQVELFALTANNITYGIAGEAMGYWKFFPVDGEHGCIPVWGFGSVVETRCPDVTIGMRLFGYYPMGADLVIQPANVGHLTIDDATPHRSDLHPWYNRYFRCENDPLWTSTGEPMQAVMWPLFMTGWTLAKSLAESTRTVIITSASSKTSMSAAWSAKHARLDGGAISTLGLTSAANIDFVEHLGVYDRVVAYDDIDSALVDVGVEGPAVLVDAAGNMDIKQRVHRALGDRLAVSFRLGATHQGAGASSEELVGPTPELFFVPDVADRLAADHGFARYYGAFADAWTRFLPWVETQLSIERSTGLDNILNAYRSVLTGRVGPSEAIVLGW